MFRIRNLFAGLYAEWMVPDLLAVAADGKPDVIVREVAEFGGCIAAEVLGIPHASVRSNTMLSSGSARHLVAEQMAGLRGVYNLEPDPDAEMLFRYLHLALNRPGFSDPRSRPSRPLICCARFRSATPERRRCRHGSGTCQTVRRFTRRSARFSIRARRDCSRRSSRDCARNRSTSSSPSAETASPSDFGLQPDNVHIERYIPQGLLLPHCDLVITHAGFSTVAATLSHGLPMVTIPIDADQPVNAQRCAALGVAEVIEYGHRTPESIRESVRTGSSNPSYRLSAERIRDQTAALPGPDHAAAILERLATEKQPMTAA